MKIATVCAGNLLRSNVLALLLRRGFGERSDRRVEVYSTGISPREEHPDSEVRAVLGQIEAALARRGVAAKLVRNPWSAEAERRLLEMDATLVATEEVGRVVAERLRARATGGVPRISTFHDFAGVARPEGLPDPFDYKTRRLDPDRLERCLDELEALAQKIVPKLAANAPASSSP